MLLVAKDKATTTTQPCMCGDIVQGYPPLTPHWTSPLCPGHVTHVSWETSRARTHVSSVLVFHHIMDSSNFIYTIGLFHALVFHDFSLRFLTLRRVHFHLNRMWRLMLFSIIVYLLQEKRKVGYFCNCSPMIDMIGAHQDVWIDNTESEISMGDHVKQLTKQRSSLTLKYENKPIWLISRV